MRCASGYSPFQSMSSKHGRGQRYRLPELAGGDVLRYSGPDAHFMLNLTV